MQARSSSAQMLMRAHLHAILNSEKSRGQWGGGGGGEKKELFLPQLPSLCPYSRVSEGLKFLLSPVFLRNKDGGHTMTNTNRQS